MWQAIFGLGRCPEAVSGMKRAVALRIDPAILPEAHHTIGHALERMGRVAVCGDQGVS